MDTAPDHSLFPGWGTVLERRYETARAALERSLDVQRTAVDDWTAAVEPTGSAGAPQRAQLRRLEWAYDLWEETLSNTLVHLDDAITGRGVDLRRLQMIWLHAMDDAFSDVMSRPAFAAETNDTLEDVLTGQRRLNHLSRDLRHASNLPTDDDLEAVGERLLDLEARQKRIEAKLDAVLDAVDGTGAPGVVE